ncbi:taurine dioxygenase [Leptospira langatensis]|uniref:Taurine dioxygenase n=1 Tax=Leptospira langatensis TaxID=2484983 RepID=A0A5F1ZYF0_9LEPT|nr:TauD/TfdA family dioxygenase [Leptospira langatensis]TGJ98159.1 taurine dioxygenase [Leptospira langatensis]TGL43073.1 taurine dioxygenase [Leptospira langatensis]
MAETKSKSSSGKSKLSSRKLTPVRKIPKQKKEHKENIIFKDHLPGLKLPIVYSPSASKFASEDILSSWIKKNQREIQRDLLIYGAILFRGFEIEDSKNFEKIALALDSNLSEAYLGTSPRDKVTKYVHTASELPSAYPIMQHAEMSFLDQPPKKLFFYAKTAPNKNGETPITDLRAVLKQIPENIRKKIEEKGVRYIRHYDGPDSSRFSLWKTKRWSEMFNTTRKENAEKEFKKQNFQHAWLPKNKLRLTNIQVGTRRHPSSGTEAWHNHIQTFHIDSPRLEYKYVLNRQRTLRGLGVFLTLNFLTFFKKLFHRSEELDVHATYGDGVEISQKEIKEILDVFWKNIQIFSWKKNDILYIDNYSVSHGRLPFVGPREIQVAWTK